MPESPAVLLNVNIYILDFQVSCAVTDQWVLNQLKLQFKLYFGIQYINNRNNSDVTREICIMQYKK